MAQKQTLRSFRPALESLERRETPSASGASTTLSQTFDTTAVGHMPGGWSQWSTGSGFTVSSAKALSDPHSLATGTADQAARAWLTSTTAGDVKVSASVYLNGLEPGMVLARGSNLNSSNPTFYYLDVRRGLYAQLVKVVGGKSTVLGTVTSQNYLTNQWVTITLSVQGSTLQAQIYNPATRMYLNSAGNWQSGAAWALQKTDTSITRPGQVGVGRVNGATGALYVDNFSVSYSTGSSSSSSSSTSSSSGAAIPQHYDWIRIAELAYSGTPLDSTALQLLKNSVDLVVSEVNSLTTQIASIAPHTPQLAYSNVSNLYGNLLLDWLSYAHSHGISPESAFYHVSQATPFSGSSSSSQPVNWFWGVYQGGSTPDFVDYTSAAHSSSTTIPLGGQGTSLYVGYPEQFNQINFSLYRGRSGGWSEVVEYPTAVDAQGNPTAWAPLKLKSDSTGGLAHSGQILFDPPANWKPSLAGGNYPLYYLRIRTVGNGTAPVVRTVLGDDYVHANGRTSGVIPAFDYSADTNHDGYLSDAEWAHRKPGMNARFAYQGRVFYASYGQERFAANPSSTAFQAWAVQYIKQFLGSHPNSAGIFMDNSGGNPFVDPGTVRESIATYSWDYGALLAKINKAVAPHWILANTSAGTTADSQGNTTADGVISQNHAYFDEFALRPLSQTWAQFENLAGTVAHWQGLGSSAPYGVLDAYPAGGSPTDARTELATLAEYYLLADPKKTFLDPFGGYEPGTTWSRHWIPAIKYNVGQPTGEWSLLANGADPSNHALTYHVYQRSYQNALVLYRPLSYTTGVRSTASLGSGSAVTVNLGGKYRPLNANGTLGSVVTRITISNGQGAILIKA